MGDDARCEADGRVPSRPLSRLLASSLWRVGVEAEVFIWL